MGSLKIYLFLLLIFCTALWAVIIADLVCNRHGGLWHLIFCSVLICIHGHFLLLLTDSMGGGWERRAGKNQGEERTKCQVGIRKPLCLISWMGWESCFSHQTRDTPFKKSGKVFLEEVRGSEQPQMGQSCYLLGQLFLGN